MNAYKRKSINRTYELGKPDSVIRFMVERLPLMTYLIRHLVSTTDVNISHCVGVTGSTFKDGSYSEEK